MKKYETPQIEISPIYTTDIFTESTGDGEIDLPEDKFD